jgi:Chaperone of endosialidase
MLTPPGVEARGSLMKVTTWWRRTLQGLVCAGLGLGLAACTARGPAGVAGQNGASVTSTQLGVGDANCPSGGVAFTSAGGTAYACNGAPGASPDAGPPQPVHSILDYDRQPGVDAAVDLAAIEAAVGAAANDGWPVYFPAGTYLLGAGGVRVTQDRLSVVCAPGAVFRKMATSNGWWLQGASDRLLGACEIDGNGQSGSGVFVDSGATDAQLDNVSSHHNGGHGILNLGARTRATNDRTEYNAKVGFANSAATSALIAQLVSRFNGNEGLTLDNPNMRYATVLGGYFEGNCTVGGVGNIGTDASVGVTLVGVMAVSPNPNCPWNLTAQNNVGTTDGLHIVGGYFGGADATGGDIHFKKNGAFTTTNSTVDGVVSASTGASVVVDLGATNNFVRLNASAVPPALNDPSTTALVSGAADLGTDKASAWLLAVHASSVNNRSGFWQDASRNVQVALRDGTGALVTVVNSTGSSYFTGGNVGIGTAAPAYALDVNGSARATGSVSAWSDVRGKKNIEDIHQATDKLLQVRGVTFDWRQEAFPGKAFKRGRDMGVIAQDVERVFPEAVQTDAEGYKSVAYTALVAPLIEATRELHAQALEQARQLRALEKENVAIRAQLQALRAVHAGGERRP